MHLYFSDKKLLTIPQISELNFYLTLIQFTFSNYFIDFFVGMLQMRVGIFPLFFFLRSSILKEPVQYFYA